jgi:hypothetical protein
MLAAELVAVEATGAQPAPNKFFSPCFLFAKFAGAFNVGHECKYGKCGAKMKFVFSSPSS